MRDVFTLAFIISIAGSTIRTATPLVLAALGGLFSERSGVINIALEGKMLAGAFTAAAVTYAADTKLGMGAASPWVGLLGGLLAGLFIAAIYAVSCIKFKADQVVSGAAINIMMIGSSGLFKWRVLSFFGFHTTDSEGSSAATASGCVCGGDYRFGGGCLVRLVQNAVRFATAIRG